MHADTLFHAWWVRYQIFATGSIKVSSERGRQTPEGEKIHSQQGNHFSRFERPFLSYQMLHISLLFAAEQLVLLEKPHVISQKS